MVCTSINGWELTQQDGNIVVSDYDGFKVGEFNDESEAKDFCLTNDPLSPKNEYWEVCLNVPVERRKSDCCSECPQATVLGEMTFCKLGRDE